ncbi:uncharacterized protein LOC121420389 [Lytechinus variegatus]|uniref:uncharacterized protein LOC121420389 n=1 Tax=Lytechinus variegatus TaxID=7654 RepID=UPI001BB0F6C7|nr:uncharacterized protein LOC121420389 [Lytechinus variegatus]
MATSTTMKLCLLEVFEIRSVTKSNYEFLRGAAIDEKGEVVEIQVPSSEKGAETVKKLKARDFFMLMDPNVVTTREGIAQVRVTKRTKVFSRCGKFEVRQEIVEEYLKPRVVPVRTAKDSPAKKRVSITGIVSSVSDVRGVKRKYRELFVMDDEDQVKVMIWGEEALRPIKSDSCVTLTGLEVGVDGKGVTLHSSPSTIIERQRFTEEKVEAATDEGFPMQLFLESGEVLEINRDFGIDWNNLPCRVSLERSVDGELLNIVCME